MNPRQKHEKPRKGRSADLCILLFDDEWPHVVPGFIVVFGVSSVTERELQAQG